MTITSLTSEQRAAIPAHVQRWINIGLSTAPMDRERATQAVLKCYELAGLPMPRIEFVWSFQTAPIDARVDIWHAVWYSVGDVVKNSVWVEVGSEVWDAVWEGVVAEVQNAVWDAFWDAGGYAVEDAVLSGQYASDTCAFWRFFTDVLGIELHPDVRARLDAWCALVESCGGVYWGREVATIVDQPEVFVRDSDGRITAVVYRDGWKVQV